MNNAFAVLPTVPLKAGTGFVHSTDAPHPARLEDPALSVMTNFRQVRPITVGDETCIDAALDKMKYAGVRMLFVVNDNNSVTGLVSAADIMGEKPVKIARETRAMHTNIRVGAVMKKVSKIRTLLTSSVRNAEIGHIAATLRQHDLSYILVVDAGRDGSPPIIVGLFSANDIGKRLGHSVRPLVSPAHSLAELVNDIA